jgi:tetratricopeptide (TPR) repeat protein
MRPAIALALISTLFAGNAYSQQSPSATQCVALSEQNKPAEAEPFCASAAKESMEGKLLYADFRFRLGDYKGAMLGYDEILQGADLAKPTPWQLQVLAHRAIAKLNFSGAVAARSDIDAYLAVRPNDIDLMVMLVQFAPSDAERVTYARQLLALKPDDMEFNITLVDALIRDKEYPDAIAAAEAAVKLDPASGIALTWRGFAHGAAGDHVKAERDHGAVARLLPKEPQPRLNRANALMQQQRFTEAIAAASDALALKPDYYEALAVRAEARLRMGDAEGALADHRSAQRVAPRKVFSNFEDRVNAMVEAHKAMTPEAIARIEADRNAVLEALAAEMHRECGHYSVPDFEDNERLNAYRDCTVHWSSRRQDMATNFSSETNESVRRFYGSHRLIESADSLRCSKMPKKARCVEDSAYARAQAAFAGMDNPTALIGTAEWDRLNREVDVYNARLSRQEKINKYVSFMQALSDALAAQAE